MTEKNNDSKLCKVLCRLSALPDAEENAVVMRKGCSESTKNPNGFLTIDGEKILRSEYIKTHKPEPLYDTALGLKPRKKSWIVHAMASVIPRQRNRKQNVQDANRCRVCPGEKGYEENTDALKRSDSEEEIKIARTVCNDVKQTKIK